MGRNGLFALFDPEGLRPSVVNWEEVCREVVLRLQRETLHNPHDERLAEVLEELFRFPGVPEAWRRPDFSRGSAASVKLRLRFGERELGFLTTMTRFNAPQNVTLEELLIESYFPTDAGTQGFCRAFAAMGEGARGEAEGSMLA